jgi:hypothetical protein
MLIGELDEKSQKLLARCVSMLIAINLLMSKEELMEVNKLINEIAIRSVNQAEVLLPDDEDLCASGHTI